ncbi:MAG: hypothetical protein VX252_17560 [Myxococcota bacterium]|nr:hypothetical protein [Myxococcota bacterium]
MLKRPRLFVWDRKQSKTTPALGMIAWMVLLLSACSMEVQMKHDPMIASGSDTITFTAETEGGTYLIAQEIKMFVGGSLVQTCTSSPCVYTGGPYASYTNDWLIYHVEAEGTFEVMGLEGKDVEIDLGATGITDTNRKWKDAGGVTFVPVRWGAHSSINTNILFHRSGDYNDESIEIGYSDFLDDLSFKTHDILMTKEEIQFNMDDLNIYAYRRTASTSSGCPGTLNALAFSELGSFADDHGVMHVTDFQDCTGPSFDIFSFEGATDTQAYLHETSHAVFLLGDEYDGNTYYFEADDEPNIFDLENTCRVEQVSKGRDPDDCYEYTTRQTGWWGTHGSPTVMTNGRSFHPWSVESVERLRHFFGIK